MGLLIEAPGVIKEVPRLFVTREDVAILLGCKKSLAYNIVRELNEITIKKGKRALPAGKANKYIFADSYEFPIEDVDRVINRRGVMMHSITCPDCGRSMDFLFDEEALQQ